MCEDVFFFFSSFILRMFSFSFLLLFDEAEVLCVGLSVCRYIEWEMGTSMAGDRK